MSWGLDCAIGVNSCTSCPYVCVGFPFFFSVRALSLVLLQFIVCPSFYGFGALRSVSGACKLPLCSVEWLRNFEPSQLGSLACMLVLSCLKKRSSLLTVVGSWHEKCCSYWLMERSCWYSSASILARWAACTPALVCDSGGAACAPALFCERGGVACAPALIGERSRVVCAPVLVCERGARGSDLCSSAYLQSE